jgi:hypothetical protein
MVVPKAMVYDAPPPLAHFLKDDINIMFCAHSGGNMAVARIYRPAKTAMQSGAAKTKLWRLDYEPALPKAVDPLTGWTSTADMQQQVTLSFATKEEAIAFAERNGIPFRVFEPQARKPVKRAYADNFKFGRVGSWTH